MHILKAVANTPVPVTTGMNIKVPENLNLQPRRHTDTLIFTSIHLMHLMIHFLCIKLKKLVVSKNIDIYIFIFYQYCNYNQIRWWYTSSTFLELKVPVFKTVYTLTTNKFIDNIPTTHFSGLQVPVLEPQTNPMTTYR